MATKTILLATTDFQTVVDVNEALGAGWQAAHVGSEAEVVARLEEGSFEALLVDFNLGSPDASELLNQAGKRCPDITRFLFACEADLALVAAKVEVEHELLPKPLDLDTLTSRIEKGLGDPSASNTEAATGFDNASPIPSIYTEVIEAIETPGATSQQVGKLIASDSELSREVLMLTRSAYQGLPSNIVNPAEAVAVLGLETVRTLAMALRFLAEHSHVRPGYLSLEKIWQHSISVGQIARDLVLFETKDRALASQALAAGLVHDLGKVVLATNFDDLYGRVHSLARNQPVALWDIEKEMFGANHGEIGACLLGMWNLPGAVVDAAALHHEPPMGEHSRLTPLVAIHIANVLEHQLRPTNEFRVLPVVNAPFLNQLGLLQRLPIWRAAFANQKSHVQPEAAEPVQAAAPTLESTTVSGTATLLPEAIAETQTATAAPADQKPQANAPSWRRQWVYTGFLAIALFFLALVIRSELGSDRPLPVRARAFHNQATIPVSSSTLLIEPAPVLTPEVISTPIVAEEAPAAEIITAPEPTPAPEPTVVAKAVETEVLPVSVTPKKTEPAFRLNGVMYNASHSFAIVNGRPLMVGETLDGITVISIGRDEVLLDINGERRTVGVPGADGRF